MTRRKLDEQDKSKKNLQQQIRHTEDRIQDTEFALENENMDPERREELKQKNENRRKSMKQKKEEF